MIPYDKSGRRICTGGLSVALPSFLMETEEDERLSFGKRRNFSSQTAFIKLKKKTTCKEQVVFLQSSFLQTKGLWMKILQDGLGFGSDAFGKKQLKEEDAQRRRGKSAANRQKADVFCDGQTNRQTLRHILKGEHFYQMILEG